MTVDVPNGQAFWQYESLRTGRRDRGPYWRAGIHVPRESEAGTVTMGFGAVWTKGICHAI